MRWLGVAVVALSLPFAAAHHDVASAATEPPDASTLAVAVDGPPADRAAIDLTLTLDGADVTEQACTTVEINGLPELECAILPPGTYALEARDTRADTDVDVYCTDLVANQISAAAIPASETVGDVGCFVQVGGPSILFTGVDDDPFDPVLFDTDGNVVACVDEDLTFDLEPRAVVRQRRWCATPPGSYRVDEDSIDPQFRNIFFCNGVVGPPDLDFDIATDPFNSIEIIAEVAWITCNQGSFGPISFFVDWSGPANQTAAWFDDLELTLRDESGAVTSCVKVDAFSAPGNEAVRFLCDVPAGRFTPSLIGFPTGSTAISLGDAPTDPAVPCGIVDNQDTGLASCAVSIVTPASPTPGSDVELPATGRVATPMLAVGSTLLVLGLCLLTGSRRRFA